LSATVLIDGVQLVELQPNLQWIAGGHSKNLLG
jgi:hypothetical protein